MSAVATGRLAELEAVIEQNLPEFLVVGKALVEIRDGRWYLETHRTWEEYVSERWAMTGRHARRLVAAAREALSAPDPMGPLPIAATERSTERSVRRARPVATRPSHESVGRRRDAAEYLRKRGYEVHQIGIALGVSDRTVGADLALRHLTGEHRRHNPPLPDPAPIDWMNEQMTLPKPPRRTKKGRSEKPVVADARLPDPLYRRSLTVGLVRAFVQNAKQEDAVNRLAWDASEADHAGDGAWRDDILGWIADAQDLLRRLHAVVSDPVLRQRAKNDPTQSDDLRVGPKVVGR